MVKGISIRLLNHTVGPALSANLDVLRPAFPRGRHDDSDYLLR